MATDNNNKAKLYYYKVAGRANQIRLCLAAADIEWEEENPSGYPPTPEDIAKWREIGGNTTTNIPMLVMPDGKVYCQSHAIIRAIGRMGKLMPPVDDDDLMYKLDKMIADAEDLRKHGYGSATEFGATQEAINAYIEDKLPTSMANFERQLGGDWLVGSSLTVADCTAYDAIVTFGLNRVQHTVLEEDKYPKLKAWIQRFEANPGIAKYHASQLFEGLLKFSPISKK